MRRTDVVVRPASGATTPASLPVAAPGSFGVRHHLQPNDPQQNDPQLDDRSDVSLARCVIVIVAYEASGTITEVLDRIPAGVVQAVGAILVSDDSSRDDTAVRARGWADRHDRVAFTVVRQPVNLGYGGNQRFCYQWAAGHGFDHVVMIHGDGQYAPELAERMLRPLLDGTADAVLGSRMIDRDGARRGGMPLYKRLGNRVLTAFQNLVTGLELSEWHCGYRAYSLAALEHVDLDALSAGFDFDTQIILALAETRTWIVEIPIPTRYGDEICRVNGLRYAGQVSATSCAIGGGPRRRECATRRRRRRQRRRRAGARVKREWPCGRVPRTLDAPHAHAWPEIGPRVGLVVLAGAIVVRPTVAMNANLPRG